ncbi:hypothetical protein CBR_g50252 [Chara braunii]|uniref:Integrase zinc-binding domain-containing protein n=1 Tax=Chara braunii TaxID=69332 RepID=A0A388M6E2_CHABU|nr:hypothetical protein CBR_g50252 [Chara braunii]|eukprot:GBG90158.1 hypothetical protein CBR_g50252 [Chara braunii]
MPESGGVSDGARKILTLEDLIAAIDRHEKTPSNVPKVDTFHFNGERVSDWLDLVEQAMVGWSDAVKFLQILRYVLHGHHQEVGKVMDAAHGSWARFREGMQRKYRLGDGLLTTADLEAMNKDNFTTIGAFVHEFKKRARKVHGISEEAQCAIFLGLLTASEASELTSHGGGSAKLTWATIDKGVEDGSLDHVEQHQVGKVKVGACFFIMPDVDHEILLGRSFLSRIETVIFNKHDGTLILVLCDPACGNYEVITCRNTGPRSIRNRPNQRSFTIEESEGERRRLLAEPEEEERIEAFSLSLSDVSKVIDIVAAHEMTDPDAIQALREQIDVIAALHDGIAGGHRGVSVTYTKISELYYWDGMMDMIGKFCRSYVPCQERSRLRPGEPLHPRLEREVGAVMHLDLLFMPLGDQDYNYIFDARDNLSGFVDGRAILTKAWPVLVSCIEEYYLRYPFVREFVMDRGSEFTCQEVQELLSRSDFTKTVVPRGGRGTRPPRRPLGASGGYEQYGSRHRESTPVYDDGDIELFLDSFWGYAERMGWTTTQAIERLRGAGRFAELIAQIRREAMTRSEVEMSIQELRSSSLGPHGRPIRLEIGNAETFIPAFEWFMQGQGIPRDDRGRTLPLWTSNAERPLARQIGDMARDWESCRAHLREAFRRPEPPQPRVERRQRSRRQRDPEPSEARPSRGGQKALARREEESAPEAERRGAYPECGLGPVAFHRFTKGELGRPPLHTPEETPTAEEPLREFEAHLDISRWRVSPRGEERGGQAEEEPREEMPREDVPREEVRDAQRERRVGDEGRCGGKEVIEVGEDTPPRTPVVGLRLGDLPGSARERAEESQREEDPLPSSEMAPSPGRRAEKEGETASVRGEDLTLIDRYLAAHALEHPDLEEPAPVESRKEPCQPEREMEAEIPGRANHRKKTKAEGYGLRLETMEVEIQELRTLVASQAAIIEDLRQQLQGRADKAKSSQQGEQRQSGHGLSDSHL